MEQKINISKEDLYKRLVGNLIKKYMISELGNLLDRHEISTNLYFIELEKIYDILNKAKYPKEICYPSVETLRLIHDILCEFGIQFTKEEISELFSVNLYYNCFCTESFFEL